MQSTITKTLFKIADFIDWKRQNKLELAPEFQRRSVWKKGAKSFLIDTIARGLPIPIIFIRDKIIDIDTFKVMREVIDGQQRLRTIFSFVCPELLDDFNSEMDDFKVSRTHNPELSGKRFAQLSDETKEKILGYEFNVHILPTRMDDREVYQIFRRMNSTNYGLTKQELRNAQWFGEFKSLAYDLSEKHLSFWRKWKTFTPDNIARMVEVEFVSQCLIAILEGKISGKSDPKIDSFYKDYDESFVHKAEISKRFCNILENIDELFSSSGPSFVFIKQKIFYPFFVYLYDLFYNLSDTDFSKSSDNKLSAKQKNQIMNLNQKVFDKDVSSEVLEAMDRRTTNIKERKRIFDFFKSGS